LNGIENLTNLEYLNCLTNELINLEGIENLTNLNFLGCCGNKITSLKEIKNDKMNDDNKEDISKLKDGLEKFIDENEKNMNENISTNHVLDIKIISNYLIYIFIYQLFFRHFFLF
jgi:Leucine-rich repeat (LRR) protein